MIRHVTFGYLISMMSSCLNIVSLTHCIICVVYESLFVNNESRNIGLKLMRLSFTFSTAVNLVNLAMIHAVNNPNWNNTMKQHLADVSLYFSPQWRRTSKNNRQIKSCKTRNYQVTHWIATQLNLLTNNALINLVIKTPKRNHCHTLHEENVGLPHSAQAARISSTSMNLRKRK